MRHPFGGGGKGRRLADLRELAEEGSDLALIAGDARLDAGDLALDRGTHLGELLLELPAAGLDAKDGLLPDTLDLGRLPLPGPRNLPFGLLAKLGDPSGVARLELFGPFGHALAQPGQRAVASLFRHAAHGVDQIALEVLAGVGGGRSGGAHLLQVSSVRLIGGAGARIAPR